MTKEKKDQWEKRKVVDSLDTTFSASWQTRSGDEVTPEGVSGETHPTTTRTRKQNKTTGTESQEKAQQREAKQVLYCEWRSEGRKWEIRYKHSSLFSCSHPLLSSPLLLSSLSLFSFLSHSHWQTVSRSSLNESFLLYLPTLWGSSLQTTFGLYRYSSDTTQLTHLLLNSLCLSHLFICLLLLFVHESFCFLPVSLSLQSYQVP